MVEYFEIPPSEVLVDAVNTKILGIKSNSAWVYVSIFGEGNIEAVTVIVSNKHSTYLIQELEWRRP